MEEKCKMTNQQTAALVEAMIIIAKKSSKQETIEAFEQIKRELKKETAPRGDSEAVDAD